MSSNTVPAVLHSEWIKARSTVGSLVTLPLALVISLGLALAGGLSTRNAIDSGSNMLASDFNPINSGFNALLYGNLAFVVFAVLVFSSEYTSGMIRASLAAVPTRGLFYLAKLLVVAAVALIVGGTAVIASFLITQSALGPHGASLSDPGAMRAVLGGVAYVVLINVFSAAVAALLRSTALTLGILMPLFFVVGPALGTISGTKPVAQFLPDQAGMRAMQVTADSGELTAGQGILVLLLWTLTAAAVGYWLIRRRDA
ncbi:ABC transporter permease [Micromonospora trifolii]|uniref:ABC transporter permease n=1 Tax=Micromonospora trifolii TaxID=2911208 RepID=UPI003D2EDC2B